MRRLSFLSYAGLVAMMLFGIIAVSATTAQAQYGYGSVNVAVNNGYQLGYGAGSNDRAYGRGFRMNDEKAYRDADSGYSSSGFRDKDTYRQYFRQGFEQGYQDGYNGYQRQGYFNEGYNNRRYNNRRYYDDRDYRNIRRREHRRNRIYIRPWPY
jgi:hypothetical protein